MTIDAKHFRRVLGHFPTGVAVISGLDPDGKPAGMAIGSFTSVSLDPPLVAFLPDKTSTSWPKIAPSGKFCVNILASEQESVCRAFAVKGGDKFAQFEWSPCRITGSPRLDDVVAWIDCEVESVTEAGRSLHRHRPGARARRRQPVAAAAVLPGRLRPFHRAVARGLGRRPAAAAAIGRRRPPGDGSARRGARRRVRRQCRRRRRHGAHRQRRRPRARSSSRPGSGSASRSCRRSAPPSSPGPASRPAKRGWRRPSRSSARRSRTTLEEVRKAGYLGRARRVLASRGRHGAGALARLA